MGNTSMVDGVACGFVRLCWLWGACLRVCVWVGACCRVLGRCALVVACVACASLECGGVWVVVGGLVVICIVDASIIVLCSCAACLVIVNLVVGCVVCGVMFFC